MAKAKARFIIGRTEWVALPELGLPAIKAKIDTGARTSALHAFLIEPYGPASAPMVRFGVHPVPGRSEIAIYCTAPVVGRREVTSSNGEKESRFVIAASIAIGDRTWPIEIGLTNRQGMTYRMLLGRQAIRADMMVDPASSFRQSRLSYRLYKTVATRQPASRPLKIALLARDPDAASNRALAETAAARGHALDRLDIARLALTFAGGAPCLTHAGKALPAFDAVLPRVGTGDGRIGAALVRQLELSGAFAVNSGDALDRRLNPFALAQALSAVGVRHDIVPGEPGPSARSVGKSVRVLLVGGRPVAVLRQQRGRDRDATGERLSAVRTLAERAAMALDLGLAGVEVDVSGTAPRVIAVTARPALSRYAKASGAPIADEIMALIEARVGAEAGKG